MYSACNGDFVPESVAAVFDAMAWGSPDVA